MAGICAADLVVHVAAEIVVLVAGCMLTEVQAVD